MKQKESRLSENISKYLQRQYPHIIFRFDIADLKLTMLQTIRMKKLQGANSRGYSDLFIAKPTSMYHGFFLELKNGLGDVYLKDGKTYRKKTIKKKNGDTYDHIQEQVKFLNKMKSEGYQALFGFGFDDCKIKIDKYLCEIK